MKRLVATASILVLTLGTAALAQTSGTGTSEKPGTSAGTSGSMSGTSGATSGTSSTRNMPCERRTPSNQMGASGPSGEKQGAAKPADSECGPRGTSGSSASPGARGGGASGAGH